MQPNGVGRPSWCYDVSMSLLTLWQESRDQLEGKRLDQLIAFAGDGKLMDGGTTSTELRELLAAAPSTFLTAWKDEALSDRYDGFGFVLQDLVNEVGNRLGFKVASGLYRGRSGMEGHDGIWKGHEGHVLLVETKTSSSHRIELRRLAEARRRFVTREPVDDEACSTLIVIAEEDTEELEAQVRGSRSAWEVRLLGVESLYKLLSIRESLDDESVERRIQNILVPQEFTRLDKIIELVFATAEDVQDEDSEAHGTLVPESGDESVERESAASFHAQILPELERRLGTPLVKRSRVLWSSPDNSVLVSCQVSKTYRRGQSAALYWFGLKIGTEQRLAGHPDAKCAFGLGSPSKVLLIPFSIIQAKLGSLLTTSKPDGSVGHWHIKFRRNDKRVELLTEREGGGMDVTDFLIPIDQSISRIALGRG